MAAGVLSIVAGAVKGLVSPAMEIYKGWQTRKQIKLESDVQIQNAKTQADIKKIQTGQAGDIAWENKSIDNSGWKDEWFVIILSIPAVLCFIPGMAATVAAGFLALAECPVWYQWGLSIAIGSSFGVKEFTKFQALRKGN